MSKRIKALLIRPEDHFTGTLISIELSVTAIQKLLGDFFDEVLIAPGVAGPWHGYKVEDADYKGLPLNHTAALLGAALEWNQVAVPCGPFIFCGGRASGESIDVPDSVLAVARELDIRITEGE